MLSTGLANTFVKCAEREYVSVKPPNGASCSTYLDPYIKFAGGYFETRNDGSCAFCQMSSTNTFLKSVNSLYSEDGEISVFSLLSLLLISFLR